MSPCLLSAAGSSRQPSHPNGSSPAITLSPMDIRTFNLTVSHVWLKLSGWIFPIHKLQLFVLLCTISDPFVMYLWMCLFSCVNLCLLMEVYATLTIVFCVFCVYVSIVVVVVMFIMVPCVWLDGCGVVWVLIVYFYVFEFNSSLSSVVVCSCICLCKLIYIWTYFVRYINVRLDHDSISCSSW